MQWLTAILAFAVTMLVFAIITSTLVEMIHRIFRLRAGGMRLMLENLYEKVISPHLLDPKPDAATFASIIMENRATSEAGRKQATGWVRAMVNRIAERLLRPAEVTGIPVEIFTQKLADARIVKQADNLSEAALTDIAQKYEAFGREASAYFESRARLFSVLVAVGVAWMFFIHPYKIAVTYVKNPEIAAAVADEAERVKTDFEALEERLRAAEANAAGADAATATSAEFDAAVKALKEELATARARTAELAAAGVPIGWPGDSHRIAKCSAPAAPPSSSSAADGAAEEQEEEEGVLFAEACTAKVGTLEFTRPTLASMIWLMLGGLLVGLGAPFWARAVSQLAGMRGAPERIAEIVSGADEEETPEAQPRTRTGPGAPKVPKTRQAPRLVKRSKPVSNRTFEYSRSTEAKK